MKWVIVAFIFVLVSAPVLFFNWTRVVEPIFGQAADKVLHAEVSMVPINPEGDPEGTETHNFGLTPILTTPSTPSKTVLVP
jgi:hypothetical protein